MGAGAGVISDPFSLGFVVETEKQVEEHLKTHIQDLSPSDTMTHETLKKCKKMKVAMLNMPFILGLTH